MEFDYFYGEQSDQFAFYRTPKVFYTDDRFRGLSSDAKILYGILLDRVSLSSQNNWRDDAGRVFVYCTLESIQKAMGCAHQKATGLLVELEKYGLIERKKQGLGKPARIFVKNFVSCLKSAVQSDENQHSGVTEISGLDCRESSPNNTKINNTEIINTNPIYSDGDVDKDERASYRMYFYDRLGLEALFHDHPYDGEMLNEIFDLIVDTVCSKRKTIRIAGDDKPANVVKSQFMKLEYSHISYVLSCIRENTTDVRNIKQYLLAALYNASLTISNYYQAMYNNDHANGLV